ncbi:MAG: hypothetical protein OES09_14195 [Gammaproteobacteria bacterium]|nr:hypothetical protein [Gammaproteobacteria bacterium]
MTRRLVLALVGVSLVAAYIALNDAPTPTSPPTPGRVAAAPAQDRDPGVYKRAFHPNRLYLPTLIEKIGDEYFIVDSYNNRVLYSDVLHAPIPAWKVLDDALSRPHSIASDGRWYLVDDTDADRVNVYTKRDGEFVAAERIADIGRRPHRVLYDEVTQAFFVLASESQQITKLKAGTAGVVVEHTRHLSFLNGAYTRSMTIIDNQMFFVSGPGAVVVVDHTSGRYEILETIPVPRRYRSMNDIARIGGSYYLTATMNRMARCDSLAALKEDRCESVYEQYGLRGNPYYFSRFDGRYYVGEVAGRDAILVFEADAGELRLVEVLPSKR